MFDSRIFPSLVLAAAFPFVHAQPSCPAPQTQHQPWRVDPAVLFLSSGLAVDADGAPNSYLANGKGLSYTCDGALAIVDGKRVTPKTDPAHWNAICNRAWTDAQASGDYSHLAIFGFLSDKNGPMLQKEGDPLPGTAYITTTTLTISQAPAGTQRHWVDATRIPYIVLTPAFTKANHVKPGDLAVVYRPKTSSIAYAVFADSGPDLGEASVKLHQDLGSNPIVVQQGVSRAKRGLADSVLTLVFPGKNIPAQLDSDAWSAAIKQQGENALKAWGGASRLQACAESASHAPQK